MMDFLKNRTLLSLMLLSPCICFAANDCNAVVTKKSQVKKGASWAFEFNVKTYCENSTGRFSYSYIDDKDRSIERRSPSWTASDGKSFVLEDEISEPGGVRSLTIINSSIESKKVP